MIDLLSMTDDIFSQIRNDFNMLWTVKRRNATIEFITPYTMLSGEVVSVFVTQRENGYVVSDAGRIAAIADEQDVELESRKTFHYAELLAKFGISVTKGPDNKRVFCYKRTTDLKLLSSCIYDVAHFQEALVNALLIDTMFAPVETEASKYFGIRVKEVLKDKVHKLSTEGQRYELFTDDSMKFYQFTAGIRRVGSEDRWMGMSICRTNLENYNKSVMRAEVAFSHARKGLNGDALHLSSISDVLPMRLQNNKKVGFLKGLMDQWKTDFGVENHSYEQVNVMESMDLLFHRRVA